MGRVSLLDRDHDPQNLMDQIRTLERRVAALERGMDVTPWLRVGSPVLSPGSGELSVEGGILTGGGIYLADNLTGSRIVDWRTAHSMYMGLPGLVGFWPASVSSGGYLRDVSGCGRAMTLAGDPAFNRISSIPFIQFDGSGDYAYVSDDAALSVTGTESYIYSSSRGLTLGGWFYPMRDTANEALMAKWGSAGQYSYSLATQGAVAGDPLAWTISDDGTNYTTLTTTGSFAVNTWQLFIARFWDSDTGYELALFNDDVKETATTTRNAVYDGTADFTIGGAHGGTSLYNGRYCLGFLCEMALSDEIIDDVFQSTRGMFGV